jgi:hypothetical protein
MFYLQRFVKPYYIANAFGLGLFLFYRFFVLDSSIITPANHPKPDYMPGIFGFTREVELCIIGAVYAVNKHRKIQTLDESVNKTILYLKMLILAILYNYDRRIMVWFVVLFGVLQLCFKQPRYDGPNKIQILSSATFKNLVLNGKPQLSWVIFVTSEWATNAKYYYPTFAELSLRFGTQRLRFASIDIGVWPELAEELSIDTSGMSFQIPSVILYEGRKEVSRLPPINTKGEVTTKVALDKAGVIKYFELERRMISKSTTATTKET